MDRRYFITASTAVLLGASASSEAETVSPNSVFGRNVADFGVQPNIDADQSPALQRALSEAAATGAPLAFPPGIYSVRRPVRVAGQATLLSPAGATLAFQGAPPFLTVQGSLILRGLTFSGKPDNTGSWKPQSALITLTERHAEIVDCRFVGMSFPAIDIETGANAGHAAAATRIAQCDVVCRTPYAIRVSNAVGVAPSLISGNRFTGCGLHVDGDSLITGNTIGNAPDAGLRLGRQQRLGFITATNNAVYGSPVGIAISNAPDGYAMVTVNMIRGAKNGAIRAFDGDRYVGKDLVQSSSESFPYIAVGGNVSV